MKATIKTIAALAMLAFSAPAIAGGVNVYDDGDSKLKLGAKVFLDGTQKETLVDGITTDRTKGFNLGRAYLTAKYCFNSDWMMRLTTDVQQETVLAHKKTNVFLKYAYLQGKLYGDAAVLRLGVSHNPWIDYEQGLWKHRYFSKVTADTFKYDDSADIGVGLKGKLMDGLVKYWVVGVNGGGYGNLAQSNAIDYKTRLGLYPIKGLTIDVGYNTGFRGKKTFGTGKLKQTMTQVMLSYGTHDFRVGGNWINNKDKVKKLIEATTYAVWGWAKLGSGFGAVARWEQEKAFAINALTGVSGNIEQKRVRYLVGLDYSPVKHIVFTLGYIDDKTTTAKFTVGKSAETKQIGVWTQYKY
ncbi:MAG: hypothetical protein Q9M12_06455 [Mariprofundus sp.]|nr:hypothetical protein [Mariprofundus sp.]